MTDTDQNQDQDSKDQNNSDDFYDLRDNFYSNDTSDSSDDFKDEDLLELGENKEIEISDKGNLLNDDLLKEEEKAEDDKQDNLEVKEDDFKDDEEENLQEDEISSEIESIFDEDTEDKKEVSKNIEIGETKLVMIKRLLKNIKENHDKILDLLPQIKDEDSMRIKIGQLEAENVSENDEDGGKVIEGVFDGQNMIGPDGKQYSIPANYASKSKLVEGDIMKLVITENGTFRYKQIGPIERIREVGILERDNDGGFVITSEDKQWKVLGASVTYFKGEVGDEVVILVPKDGTSKWAAVENIVKKNYNA